MKTIIRTTAFFIMVFTLLCIDAEAQTNFSGRWQFNKAGSTPGLMYSEYDGIVIRQIIQDADSIKYSDLYLKPGNNDWETGKEAFSLNGKEEIKKGDNYAIKKLAKWSDDKKSLTLLFIHTQITDNVSADFLNEETYRVSDDGNSLVIETYSKDPIQGEKRTKSLYNKK
ncbi:MAG TPA: hypothetical protein VHO50_07865 [Bacteroidales bacterium]|nr:hypothetical protein [Bacteroidales bacterium]